MLLRYETNRLILKVLEPEHAADVLQFYIQDRELFERFEADRCPNFYTKEYQRNILHLEYGLCLKLNFVRFYVFLKEDPRTIIGTVSLYDISTQFARADIGYKFSSSYHHKGYASEAVEKLIDLAFTELRLHRLCARVQPENLPSIRLLEGLGFEKEGICRGYMCMHGEWVDHLQYSLLAPDLPLQ